MCVGTFDSLNFLTFLPTKVSLESRQFFEENLDRTMKNRFVMEEIILKRRKKNVLKFILKQSIDRVQIGFCRAHIMLSELFSAAISHYNVLPKQEERICDKSLSVNEPQANIPTRCTKRNFYWVVPTVLFFLCSRVMRSVNYASTSHCLLFLNTNKRVFS